MAAPLINKTVRLSKEQIAALEAEGERDRREFSALVRIAVDELLALRGASVNGVVRKRKTQRRQLAHA